MKVWPWARTRRQRTPRLRAIGRLIRKANPKLHHPIARSSQDLPDWTSSGPVLFRDLSSSYHRQHDCPGTSLIACGATVPREFFGLVLRVLLARFHEYDGARTGAWTGTQRHDRVVFDRGGALGSVAEHADDGNFLKSRSGGWGRVASWHDDDNSSDTRPTTTHAIAPQQYHRRPCAPPSSLASS